MIIDKKLIFFDVDDTLVHHRGDKSYIPDSALRSLKALRQEGHILAIASGRGHEQIRQIMKLLNIEHAVCFNGHMVVVDNEVVQSQPLHRGDVEALLSKLRKGIMPFIVMDKDHAYIKDFLGKVRSTLKKEIKEVEGAEGDMYLGRLKRYHHAKAPYYAMMFFRKSFKHKDRYPNLTFKEWGRIGYEVANAGVSKLSGIHYMADHFGISYEDVVVFGDNYNDIEMLDGIENSVAMGNAVKAAKEAAAYVTDHVGEHGIEKACYHLGLLKEETV